jgi:hypothetical protein
MKKVLLGSMLIVSCFSFGQKIKIKKNIAFVDGKEFVKVIEDPASTDSYSITNLNDKELFYLKINEYKDPKEVDYKYNKDGSVNYFEVLSPDFNTIYFESNVGGCLMCNLTTDFIKNLYFAKIVDENGEINKDKLEILSKKIGFTYSQKRDEMKNSNNGNTVIIHDSTPKTGVNISIGR